MHPPCDSFRGGFDASDILQESEVDEAAEPASVPTKSRAFSKLTGPSISADPCLLTLAEASALIAGRALSPVELTQSCLARIDALDAQVNAFITVTGEAALARAREAERDIVAGRYRGALHGIPFALKDVIDTADVRTAAHSRLLERNIPTRDAAVVERLYDAGAILLGKLATHEFAHGGPSFDLPWPPARNPWDLQRFTGGSSSGSGAAVAARLTPAALGTDTGGSIRIPAALCGVTGLKPTSGLVSRRGVIPNSFSFDHCGPIARTAHDCALLLQAIAGHDPADPGSVDRPLTQYTAKLGRGIKGVRIGVVRHFWEEDLEVPAALAAVMNTALDVLSDLGANVETVRMRPLQQYTDVKNLISESELFSVHQQDLIERAGDYGEIMRSRILAFCLFQAADYVQAERQRRRMIEEMQSLYKRYDALVNAGPGPAPLLAESRRVGLHDKWEKPKLPAAFSVTGSPALVLCNGMSDHDLPLSMEIAGRPFDEATVFQVAHAYQAVTKWHTMTPPLVAGTAPLPIQPPAESAHVPQLDDETRAYVDGLARRAGLALTAGQKAQLYEAAPHALAMAQRIDRDHARSVAPANVFRFSSEAHK